MFRNFDKVFAFTFKNQFTTPGYRKATIITGILLFLIPVAIFVIAGKVSSKGEDKGPAGCGADKIYVVNEKSPDADLSILNQMGVEGYTDLEYINASSVEEAASTISDSGEKTSLILHIFEEDGSLHMSVVVPESSVLDKDRAEKYGDFAKEVGPSFVVAAAGIRTENLGLALAETEYRVYDVSGYAKGVDIYSDEEKMAEKSNAEILPFFNMILTYVTIFVIYMIIILYGNSLLQNIVLEKTSKLMDTMLISVAPQSMIFGKMIGVLLTGIIQLLIWLAAIVLGIFTGLTIYDHAFGNISAPIVTFLKSFAELGIFRPGNVIIGILALFVGIIMYCSLAAIAGSISSSREEAASNQGVFIMLLVVSFYFVLMKGLDSATAPEWIYLFPFTSAMVLPSNICTGTVSTPMALAGLGIMVVCSVVFIIAAGRLYKMMSLYKGSPVKLGKALKMLISGQ